MKVTLIERQHGVLDFADHEIVEALRHSMREIGIMFRLGEEVREVTIRGATVIARTVSNKVILGESPLYTMGRAGATAERGLETVGIEPDARGRIKVDENYQTQAPHIYAAGDVIGFPSLASTSMERRRVAVRCALGATSFPLCW